MAYVLEFSNEDKLPRFRLEEGTTTWWGQAFGNGESVNIHKVTRPLKASQIDKKKVKYDVFKVSSKYCVSKKAKEIIEKIEPDKHLFVPIILHDIDGVEIEIERYLINIGQKVDAIEINQCKKGGWNLKVKDGEPFFSVPTTLVVLNANAIAENHLWVGDILGPTMYFTSQILGDALKRSKVTGIDLFEAEEIDEPWQKDENLGPYLEWLNSR